MFLRWYARVCWGPMKLSTDSRSDDSFMNCREAQALGWTAIHLIDPADPDPPSRASAYQIRDLGELRKILPDFFKPD